MAAITMMRIQELVASGDESGLQQVLEGGEVEGGAERDWGWRGSEGRTVLELAAVLGRPGVVRLLVSAGASANHVSDSGYSGLHMACVWGRPGCVRELVEGGGDHRLATVHHETPQQLALRYGNSECAEYLSCVEARQILQEAVQSGRARLADSELIAGKWNKEDKVKVASLCAEKTEWLAQHKDCSVHEATQQRDDFHCRLLPHLNKLQPAS